MEEQLEGLKQQVAYLQEQLNRQEKMASLGFCGGMSLISGEPVLPGGGSHQKILYPGK